MSYLDIFRLEFEKNIVIFEINVLEFVCCKVWCKTENP